MRGDAAPVRLSCLLPPVILVLAGCGAGDRTAAGAAVRDSAGVTIVESTAPAWPEGGGWRLSPEPQVEIGALEGPPERQLYRVAGAVRLADGRIVVGNSGTHEIRFYDARGRHLRSAGREGDGPGEFRGLGLLRRHPGDSLFAYDFRQRRVSIFDSNGGFGRSIALPALGDRTSPAPVGVFADGSILVRTGRVFSSRDALKTGISRDSSLYYRVGPDGAVLDTIGVFPGNETFVYVMDGGGFSVTLLPFGRSPAARAHGMDFYFGAADAYQVGIYDVDGSLRRLIRRRFANLAVTPEDIERYRQERLERAGDEWRQMEERMLAEVPFPATMPAYQGLLVDAAGNLWVEEYRRPGSEQPRWTVFDPDGGMLGTLAMPPGFSPSEIGPDYVLGTARDELDVEYVRLYALLR